MSVMGVSKGTIWRVGGAKSRWTPPFVIHRLLDHLSLSFPQDSIISSYSWHMQTTPIQLDQVFVSALIMTTYSGQCYFHILAPLPPLLPKEAIFSSLPLTQLQDTPNYLSPGLWCTAHSFCHSFSAQETSLSIMMIHPTTQPRALCLFLFPKTYCTLQLHL